ncbi:hypothetical protein [Planctellipticum variicoloris]|uniref:hypothetical protein n=1 Tax=Planctellipticum variicoloris TaxID=3064265 RepID=UPI0030137D61|nr:hypothetical protein SH412_002684 [Planctomycetaceae bacterium SH412]
MRTRLRTHARCDPKEWLTPIAVGIAALLRLWGTQLILQGAGNGREVSAPWLWHPSELANSSRPVWQRVLDRDAELTQLLKEWAVEGKIDESEDDGNE